MDCQLTIRYSANETVAITFASFDLDTYDGARNCRWSDYLAIHDGESSDSPLIGAKLCGTSPSGTTIRSTGSAMTLHFKSTWSGSGPGFRLYANVG